MINLFNVDCMEYMKTIPDKHYDLAIVDPPYGLGMSQKFHQNGENNSPCCWKKYSSKQWDSMTPDQNYFDELFRISRNQIIWGGNYFIDKIIRPSQCWLIWNKGQRGFSLADGEMAWTSFDRAVRIFDYSRATALNENRKNGGMFHPTKKPVALYIWILENYASKGDKIFDSHLGSGSIGIACHDMGFDLDACEIDIDYFQLAKERIENHQQQIQLFGAL